MADTLQLNLGWQGLTIKDILEKVDLSNLIVEDDEKKADKDIDAKDPFISSTYNPESAFLGPKLWNSSIPISITSDDEDLNMDSGVVMNIDDFLLENDFNISEPASPNSNTQTKQDNDYDEDDMETEIETPQQNKKQTNHKNDQKSQQVDHDYLYVESKRARLEREKKERAERYQMSWPGLEFDARKRSFEPEELRPQPIIRKRKRTFVKDNEKDETYWEKRQKNNIAATRSREAKRIKEIQISLRTAYLERQNAELMAELDAMKDANRQLVSQKKILLEQLQR